MGTLADKLQYLKDTKDAIMNAIIEKGVAITSSDTFRSYADKIKNIVSGDKPTIYDTISSVDKNPYDYISKDSFSDNLTSVTVVTVDNLTSNIVGSPTNRDGILSNFTDSNYVKVDSYVGAVPLGRYIYVKFKHNTTSWYNSIEHIFSKEGIFCIETNYNTLTTYNWTTNVTSTILDNFEQNTWYYAVIKVGSDTSSGYYTVDYYLSKVSYDDALANGLIFTKQESSDAPTYNYGLYFGKHCTITGRYAKDIAIDFNDTYIKNSDGSYYLQFRQTENLI